MYKLLYLFSGSNDYFVWANVKEYESLLEAKQNQEIPGIQLEFILGQLLYLVPGEQARMLAEENIIVAKFDQRKGFIRQPIKIKDFSDHDGLTGPFKVMTSSITTVFE